MAEAYKSMYGEYIKKENTGIKASKSGGNYVQNAKFLEELEKSKQRGKLTNAAVSMMILICENLTKKMHYSDLDDQKDCIQFAIMDCLQYWDRFDTEKSKNPFAYFTSVATNGFAKAWRRLGRYDCPASIITHLDSGNIHSL